MKVLVAISDRDQGLALAHWISANHWPKETKLRLLNLIPWHAPDRELIYSNTLAKYIEDQYQGAKELLKSATAIITKAHPEIEVDEEILHGHPAECILSTAAGWQAEMIIVGTHNRKGWDLLLNGSVSAAIASHAACNVLVVRTIPVTARILA